MTKVLENFKINILNLCKDFLKFSRDSIVMFSRKNLHVDSTIPYTNTTQND